MEIFILSSVILLVVLAVIDIVVGVGNDAVNFLNSAIGSKVAKFRTIMWVATAGIFVGALSSAGMMEIAREGIFNPEYFSLENVIVIFLAVILTDILLLDAFNTIGLPTSTTVSIIFELLGASIIVAASKVMIDNLPLNYLFNINDPDNGIIGLINWQKTNTIISSIFLSVLIAFTFGVFVMWTSRVIFSFRYKRRLKFIGVIWASFAMLALTYFLVYKGLKSTYSTKDLTKTELVAYFKSANQNTSDTIFENDQIVITDVEGQEMVFNKIISDKTNEVTYQVFFGSEKIKSIVSIIKENLWTFLGLSLIFWIILFSIFDRYRYNPLKIVVFAGTFALAMAFAGNDLVNFIGVPLAGYQSYELFNMANLSAGGQLSPDTYMMTGLKFPIKTPYVYLIFSGLIMVLTLWFSKKSRSVTETEVKLGTQDETEEKFSSNMLSRTIVRFSIFIGQKMEAIIPLSVSNKINAQFIPIVRADDADAPAFDLVRASVNLTLASMLIALGTSYKLPLSTTYVTFMVAMGSSLADRAWGRESATYRIAGVINVIGGWLITAIVAFCVAAIIAIILLQFKLVGLIIMICILVSFIIYTTLLHKKENSKKIAAQEVIHSIDLSTDIALQKSGKKIAESLTIISSTYSNAINGLLEENRQKLNDALLDTQQLLTFYSDIKNNLFKAIKKSKLNDKQTAQLYILSNDLMQDILQSLGYIIAAADNHVKNAHKPITGSQAEIIKKIEIAVVSYLNNIANALDNHHYESLSNIKSSKRIIFDDIENTLSLQVEGISKKEYGFKNTDLVLNILLETKDLVAISVRFEKLMHRITQGESPLGNR